MKYTPVQDGTSPFMLACKGESLNAVHFLLEQGADITLINNVS